MVKDRFVRVMLVVVAALLALNLLNSAGRMPTVASTAQAQPVPFKEEPVVGTGNRVRTVGGFRVSALQNVVSVGDGKSFVVSNPEGFMVYQVETVSLQR